jgi:phage anti-repressor protein
MNNLIIKNIINGAEVNSVNARDLHKELEVKTEFAKWVKRAIEKYDFVKNVDYIVIVKNGEKGGRPITEYITTIDMAKELAMLENNKQGRVYRKYFIEVEKEYINALTTQTVPTLTPLELVTKAYEIEAERRKQTEKLLIVQESISKTLEQE